MGYKTRDDVYKVVVEDNKKLYSAWVSRRVGVRFSKEYKIGFKTKANGTPLFIFGKKKDAVEWAEENITGTVFRVYNCLATGVRKPPCKILSIVSLFKQLEREKLSPYSGVGTSRDEFYSFLKSWWNTFTSPYLQSVPEGTLIANSVTLLKRVRKH